MFSIESVMSTELITVQPMDTLADARTLMQTHRIHHLPVVTNGELRCIITDTNFVAIAINLLQQIEESEPYEEDYG